MITHEQNEYMCRTGPGTPMGELFRRHWIPALMAEELPRPNCPPVRVQLLGERLIAFRDTQGRLGLMDEFCAHRGVSLWFGRNEENGLRCAYHGWKYDVTGQCVDVPSEPAESGFCQKIKLKAYPCVELGGVIWAYMGPPAETAAGCRRSNGCISSRRSASSPSAGRRAITCRRWRAASIRATCRSCTAATSIPIRCTGTPPAPNTRAAPTPCSTFSNRPAACSSARGAMPIRASTTGASPNG